MKILCPKCGELVAVSGLGRKRLAIPVEIVYDAVQTYPSVVAAAEKLHCSRPYIYQVLKSNNLKVKDVIETSLSPGLSTISDKGLQPLSVVLAKLPYSSCN